MRREDPGRDHRVQSSRFKVTRSAFVAVGLKREAGDAFVATRVIPALPPQR
jgi:hypothetical protein